MVNPDINVRCEQRVTIKFLMKTSATPIQCWSKLKEVWGDRTMSKTQVRVWYKHFKEGQDNVRDAPRSGRLHSARSPENIAIISGMVQGDSSLSMREMSQRTGISEPIIAKILRVDLNLSRKCSKFIPKDLSEAQKWTRKTMCDDNIQFLCDQPDPEDFIQRIITGDETWVSTYEAFGKQASTLWSEKGGLRLKKARTLTSSSKCMMTLFFDCKGIILCEFLGQKEKIKSEHYVNYET